MYYDKSMKKTILAFCACLLPAWTGAQSTCETRVDAHPHATTMQRVDYCLNDTAEYIDNNNPGLVFSGVTTRHPAERQPQDRPSAREGSFKQDAIKVNQDFVETQQFPTFTNDTLSEREVWEQRQAARQIQKQPQEKTSVQNVRLPQEKPFVDILETKAGLKARAKKPGRRLWKTTIEQTTAAETAGAEESVVQEVSSVTSEYTPDNAAVQSDAPAGQDAQEYVPATPDAQEYVPAEPAAQPYAPYAPAGQEEIPVGTTSYAPAN